MTYRHCQVNHMPARHVFLKSMLLLVFNRTYRMDKGHAISMYQCLFCTTHLELSVIQASEIKLHIVMSEIQQHRIIPLVYLPCINIDSKSQGQQQYHLYRQLQCLTLHVGKYVEQMYFIVFYSQCQSHLQYAISGSSI